jgi:uncharacterized membrane protein
MQQDIKKTIVTQRFGAQRYFIVWVILSFLGWIFETLFVFVAFGRWNNQGFLTLPFCPIYASSLMATYWLAGTPDAPRGLLKHTENRLVRYGLYALVAFLVPSIAEFIVGFIFDKGFNTWLWSYKHLSLNVMGYVCVPVSLIWMALIFIFMKWCFPWIKRFVGNLSGAFSWCTAVVAAVVLSVDFVYSVMNRLL